MALKAEVRDLLDRSLSASAADSFASHTKVIEHTIAVITDVGDASNLTLDPDIESYYLMNAVIFQAPELSEVLAQARGLGAGVAASRRATPERARDPESARRPHAISPGQAEHLVREGAAVRGAPVDAGSGVAGHGGRSRGRRGAHGQAGRESWERHRRGRIFFEPDPKRRLDFRD